MAFMSRKKEQMYAVISSSVDDLDRDMSGMSIVQHTEPGWNIQQEVMFESVQESD